MNSIPEHDLFNLSCVTGLFYSENKAGKLEPKDSEPEDFKAESPEQKGYDFIPGLSEPGLFCGE